MKALVARWRLAWATSPWTSLVVRGGFALVALLVLAWIGQASAAAARVHAQTPDTLASGEHSAAPVAAHVQAVLATATEPPSPKAPTAAQPASVPPAVVASPSPRGHARATAEDPVFINHAGVDDLRRLPGVGPKRAEAILALRQRLGRFQRVEDLLRVKGVGRTTLRKWRPLLRLDTPALPTKADAPDASTPTPPPAS